MSKAGVMAAVAQHSRNDRLKQLRDELAGEAMQAQLTAFWAQETHHGWSHEAIAQEAYKMADAMLAQREK